MTTCFFCQNLLSDYIEGILPSSRHEELKRHLDGCRDCADVHRDLITTIDLLHAIPSRPVTHDMALRITEASQAGRRKWLTPARFSQFILFLSVPSLLFAGAVISFPKLFPWFTHFQAAPDESQFMRYFPLLQGASDIVDEQANWLHGHEPFMRSVWEEGGLSPEEFEKAFRPGSRPSLEKGTGEPEGSGDEP